MKKILILLLAASLLCTTGCRSADRDSTTLFPSGNIQTEFPGMTVRIETVNTHGEATELNVLWSNKTPYDVLYGESYAIERLDDGKWVSCGKADAIFIAIGYQLKAGEEVTKSYTVSDLFDVRQTGTYRFKTTCYVYENAEEGTHCELTAEFTVAAATKTEPLLQTSPQGTSDSHIHRIPTQAQTVTDPITGYCGNTQTTLHLNGKTYTFMYGNSVTLTDILVNLSYDPHRICRCMHQFTVDTEFGTGYQIHLDNGFVRCGKGQAALTQEQIEQIRAIILWAENTNCQYNMGE